jgi:glucose dehydrogenase
MKTKEPTFTQTAGIWITANDGYSYYLVAPVSTDGKHEVWRARLKGTAQILDITYVVPSPKPRTKPKSQPARVPRTPKEKPS